MKSQIVRCGRQLYSKEYDPNSHSLFFYSYRFAKNTIAIMRGIELIIYILEEYFMKDFNCEIVNEGGRKLNVVKGSAIGIGIAGLIAGLGYIGAKAIQKLKNKEEEPENKYEDKYDYIVI